MDHVEPNIRSFDLIGEPALDDRAVLEFALAVQTAAVVSGETLAGSTRRVSSIAVGDILEPVQAAELTSLPGTLFDIVSNDTIVGLFSVSDSEAIALADIFFGGPGTGADRRLAAIELTAITSSLPQVLQPIVEAVAPTAAHGVAFVPVSDPGVDAADLVRLDLTFTIDEIEVLASIHVPDPDKSTAVDGPSNDLLEIVSGMPLRFDVDLADVTMAASDVQELAEGDVILFDSPPDGDVTVRSGNREFLRASIDGSDGRRLLCVTQVLSTQ